MSINCLVIGESGTGKSTSLRNLPPAKTAIIQVVAKPLPFKSRFQAKTASTIEAAIQMIQGAARAGREIIIVDDVQYLMAGEFMSRAREKGFDKFTDIGSSMWRLLQATLSLPEKTRIYLLWHAEFQPDGRVKAKTVGKMLDEKVTVEGMFSIVLRTHVQDNAYSFITQNQGNDTTKSPYGMFASTLVPNDLNQVDRAICSYYEIAAPAPAPPPQQTGANVAGVVVDGSSKQPVDRQAVATYQDDEIPF